MSFVGLVPSERSSGERRRQGSITKTGNAHVRRLLVEAAWSAGRRPQVGERLAQRQRAQDPVVRARAWRCQQRLYRRWRRMAARGKPRQKIVVACARELAGFVWAIATDQPLRAEGLNDKSLRLEQRMRPTTRRTLDSSMRHRLTSATRDPRPRQLPTVPSHTVPTRECQSDPPSLPRAHRCSQPRGHPPHRGSPLEVLLRVRRASWHLQPSLPLHAAPRETPPMRADLPTGTVTFLFTDIEGSTKLLHELGDGYSDLLHEHHRRLRDVWVEHKGVVVDTAGDGFFVAFGQASDAVRAAAAAQESLGGLPLRVRMGLHTGEPAPTETGYVGLDVHRAARIAGVAHGGQVLVAESTARLVDAPLHDLGSHRFKDLAAPERLFQLGDHEFPPIRSLFYASLPLQPTELVGREREVREIVEGLSGGTRLLTLTGPGGIGKTRLAVAAAAEAARAYPGGVFFVALSPVADPKLVEPSIAQVVGASASVVDHLRDSRALLVLDNFEHLLPAANEVNVLLRETWAVQMLVTSRERLGLSAEQEYVIGPLAQAEGVELFTARARQARRDFEPDADVRAIVERVDGLPLALELAAARVRVMPPRQIAERLQSSIDLLASTHGDVPERQRTLRAAIEWSYELLTQNEQAAFSALAVFAGGFALEAAESVTRVDFDTAASLVDKSLLGHDGQGRFSMLRTVRTRATELLAERPDAADLSEAHAAWVEGIVGSGANALEPIPSEAPWFELLDVEEGNLRAALDWLAEASPGRFTDLVSRAFAFWYVRGRRREGLHWVSRALEISGDRIALLSAASNLAVRLGETAIAVDYAARELEAARQVDDRRGEANAHRNLGIAAMQSGRFDDAEECYRRGVDAARAAGSEYEELLCAANIADVALHQRAWPLVVEILTPLREPLASVSAETAVTGVFNLAHAHLGLDDLEAAVELVDVAVAQADALRWDELLAASLILASAVAARRGDASTAIRLVGAASGIMDDIGAWVGPLENELRDEVRERAAEVLGPAHAARLEEDGRALAPAAAVAEARCVLSEAA
jgi:predicted ATPase/class 3 adenylate cyclase